MPRVRAGGLEGWRVRNMNIYIKKKREKDTRLIKLIAPGPIILEIQFAFSDSYVAIVPVKFTHSM